MKNVKRNIMVVLVLSFGFSLFQSAQAELLMYEGFDYPSGPLAGNGDSDWGNAANKWTVNSNALASITDGLDFENLVTKGGATQIIVAITGPAEARRQVANVPLAGSDLFISFLYQNPMMMSDAAWIYSSDLNIWASYKGSIHYGGTEAMGTNTFTDGNTYLFVAKFGNIGGPALQLGNLWVLSETDFSDIQATPGFAGFTESYLDAHNTSQTLTSATSVGSAFTTSDYVNLVARKTNGTGFNVIYDELRYGTQLTDVLPIPEPATLLLLALGSLALIRRKVV